MDVEQVLWFRGMTKSEIAGKLGISAGYFSRICRGEGSLPLRLLTPLAKLINHPVEDIVKAFDAAHGQKGSPR